MELKWAFCSLLLVVDHSDCKAVLSAETVLTADRPHNSEMSFSDTTRELGPVADLFSVLQAAGEQNVVGDPENDFILDGFRKQLELNPYYFVHWFGIGQNDIRFLTTDQLQGFWHCLFSSTKRPRTKREIEVAAECSSDVIKSEFSDRKTTVAFFIEAFVTTVLRRDGLEFDDPRRNCETIDGVLTPKKKRSHQIRSKRVVKWNRLAARANNGGLQFAEKLALQGWAIKPQYMPAVTYLNKWGRLHIALLKRKAPKCDPSEYDGAEDFNSLPNESKGLVMAAKSFYLAALRTVQEHAKAESVEAMREAARYDPKCFEWHYRLGMWLHKDRRTINVRSRPSDEEIRIRWESYEVCDYVKYDGEGETEENSMLRNMALACVMETLAEMVRFTCNQGLGRTPQRFELGDLMFSNIDEVVRFIEQNRERLQSDTYNPSFDEFVRVGDIFGAILPKPYRNDAAALGFFEKAHEMKPSNSKINHKLGLLHLMSDKFPDVNKAISLLETAYLIEKHNFGALLDLVKAMLRSPAQYKSQINQYCEDALRSSILGLQNQEEIWFILGCLNFCLGKIDDAVEYWIKSGPSLFTELSFWRKRYSWNVNVLLLEDIAKLLESYLENPSRRAGTDSNVYHQLGVLYASAEEMAKALKYLRMCNEVDSTNVPGATDLLKVLMVSPDMHASEISSVISRTMLSAGITARDKCVLFFIDGCLQFFLHNEEAAIEAWFSADKRAENLKPPVGSVFSFFTKVRHSKWNWDVLNPKQILNLIDGMLNTTISHNFEEEKIQFLEKSQQMLSTMGRAWTYKRYNRAEGGDAVQRRCRRVSESQPQAPISDQDSDWRGACNRVPLGEDSKTSNSSAYITPQSRHDSTHKADNGYKRQPNHNKFYDQPTTGTDWTSKRYYNKDNSVNDVSSSSPAQYHRHQNSYNNNNCKSRRPPSPDSWR